MLTSIILHLFVPGINGTPTLEIRTRCGIVSGITGIVCNILLVIVKVTLAVISGSIAMAADAVNNLADAGSGIITAVCFRFSGRPADAEHPFGHGRSEYVAGLIVSLLILGLGISFLKDSVISIFKPSEVRADLVTVIILSATILVKCWLFLFYRKVAKLLRSDVLRATAYENLSDCLGTLIVIGSLIAAKYTKFPMDGCAGTIVALMILWAGGSVMKDTVSKLIGEPPDSGFVEQLKKTLTSCPGIDGVHDIIIHNYGENSYYVTAHAEISWKGDRLSAHDLLENAEVIVGRTMPVHLLLHGDPYNTENPEVILWRSRIENIICHMDPELKLYDFRLGKESSGAVSSLSFHLLTPHKYEMSEENLKETLRKQMSVYRKDLSLEVIFQKSFI